MKLTEDMLVIKNEEIARDIYELVLKGQNVQLMKEAGQFVNIQLERKGLILRRPFSICEINYSEKEFKIIYRVLGEGTEELARLKAGARLNVFGPLGTGFPESGLAKDEVALLIGGGIGVPPLYELARRLHKRGNKVISVLGFQDKEGIFYVEEFGQYSELHVATMDGSYGYKGNVLELIGHLQQDFDILYACGPMAMLKSIQEAYSQQKRGYISLEERMACGIGACYGCVCDKEGEPPYQKRVCKEGPVFSLNEVSL
ncbi:MAG TPA: dihydroorotate dehydrogenase electron transfer subunit [Halanaerobiales bacterium]|nr:dihydroorotate dehydrogenase electron transfer subunit [Halanaerobiales bacterium]